MRVDPTTLLFHDLSDTEASELRDFGEAVMLRGSVADPPASVLQWITDAGFDGSQYLMVMSTVLPSRIFYSLLLRAEDETPQQDLENCRLSSEGYPTGNKQLRKDAQKVLKDKKHREAVRKVRRYLNTKEPSGE